MALDNVMLYDKSVKYNRMLIQLENATREINSFLEIIPIVFESDKHALEIFECAGCSIFLYEEPEKAFTLYYSNIVPQSEWGRIKINEKTQICQKLFQKDKINLTPTDKVQIVELSKFFNNYAIVSLIAIPKKLKEQIRPVGIIIASDKLNGEPFDEIDLEVLSIFASQLAVSLENARLFEKATHDPLTNLYNRNYLMVKLEEYMQECKNYANALSVLFADIDHFKPINDRFGHSFGDIVLKGIADIMKKVIADKGFVSRYGGEEFVIVLPYIDVDVAEKLAEQICRDIKATKFKMAKKETSCTISFGIVRMRKDDTPETILQRADSSMYQSKLKGRDRITVGK
jgi:diguanylate cyclase (GGDEF)-like protein